MLTEEADMSNEISIALPSEVMALLRKAVDTGEYASLSEAVTEALHDWERTRKLRQHGIAELRQLWQQADADRSPGLDPDEVLDRLERKYQALVVAADEMK